MGSPLKILLLSLAAILTALGFIFLIAAVLNPIRVLTALGLFSLAGIMVYFVGRQGALERAEARMEAEVLRLARARGGKLTAEDVSINLRLPLDKARAILIGLERKGSALMDFEEVEERGVEVFRFPQFESPDRRSRGDV